MSDELWLSCLRVRQVHHVYTQEIFGLLLGSLVAPATRNAASLTSSFERYLKRMLCSLRCLSRGWFWTKGCGFESLLLLYLTRSWDIRGIREDFKEFLIQCDGWWRKDKANWEVFEWQLFRTSLNLQSSDNKRFIWLCNNTEFASRLGVGNEQLHSSVLMLLHQVIASRRSQFVIKYASRLFDSNELRRVPSCESQDQVIKSRSDTLKNHSLTSNSNHSFAP